MYAVDALSWNLFIQFLKWCDNMELDSYTIISKARIEINIFRSLVLQHIFYFAHNKCVF